MSESNRPLVVRLEDQTPETIREHTGDNVSPLSIPDGGVIVSVWRADGSPAIEGVDFVGDDRMTHDGDGGDAVDLPAWGWVALGALSVMAGAAIVRWLL